MRKQIRKCIDPLLNKHWNGKHVDPTRHHRSTFSVPVWIFCGGWCTASPSLLPYILDVPTSADSIDHAQFSHNLSLDASFAIVGMILLHLRLSLSIYVYIITHILNICTHIYTIGSRTMDIKDTLPTNVFSRIDHNICTDMSIKRNNTCPPTSHLEDHPTYCPWLIILVPMSWVIPSMDYSYGS